MYNVLKIILKPLHPKNASFIIKINLLINLLHKIIIIIICQIEFSYILSMHLYVSQCTRGSRNEETRIITNGVFNSEQTEETQEHR